MDSTELAALAKVEAALLAGAKRYFDREGFVQISVPHVTRASGSCEDMDTLFEVNYFGKRAYLMQTGQLFLERLIHILDKVWCCGPSFRAEPRVDDRHLTEFTLLEMEFCGDFEELLRRMEGLVLAMLTSVLDTALADLEFLNVDQNRLVTLSRPFARLTYDQAIQMLGLRWGTDLGTKHERELLDRLHQQPLFITHYPVSMKFFNMKTNNHDPRLVNSVDLILPYCGETAGGAEREFEYEHVLEKLKASAMFGQLKSRGGGLSDFEWYLTYLAKEGSRRHAGCGVGVNRLMQFMVGRKDIRQCVLFPVNRELLM